MPTTALLKTTLTWTNKLHDQMLPPGSKYLRYLLCALAEGNTPMANVKLPLEAWIISRQRSRSEIKPQIWWSRTTCTIGFQK